MYPEKCRRNISGIPASLPKLRQENSTAPRTPPACRALHRRGRLYSRRTRRKVHAVQRSNKIVYNLAQTGTGPARKALIPTFCNLHHLPFSNSHGHVVALLAPQVTTRCLYFAPRLTCRADVVFLTVRRVASERKAPDGLKIIVKATYEAASMPIRRCDWIWRLWCGQGAINFPWTN
jgi:hypothetical protein